MDADTELAVRYGRMRWMLEGVEGPPDVTLRILARDVIRPILDDVEHLLGGAHVHEEVCPDVEPPPMQDRLLAYAGTVRVQLDQPPPYRVGRQLGRTVYEGDELIGVMDSAELGSRVVGALNDHRKCEVCGAAQWRCIHTNPVFAGWMHRARNAEQLLFEMTGETALEAVKRQISEGIRRWGDGEAAPASAALVQELRDEHATMRVRMENAERQADEMGMGLRAQNRLMGEAQDERDRALARVQDLEGEVQRLVGARNEAHVAELNEMVAQLTDARQQAVQNGQAADAAMEQGAKARDGLRRIGRIRENLPDVMFVSEARAIVAEVLRGEDATDG